MLNLALNMGNLFIWINIYVIERVYRNEKISYFCINLYMNSNTIYKTKNVRNTTFKG